MSGVGKVEKTTLNEMGIQRVGDGAAVEAGFLERKFGKGGAAMAGKAGGEDSGSWCEGEVGEEWDAKSISHEHTFNHDTADVEKLESTLAHLSEMVGRRLRHQEFSARTLQLKLRHSDFTTITRARSLPQPTQSDTEISETIHKLFHHNWQRGRAIRLLRVHASHFEEGSAQMDLLQGDKTKKWTQHQSPSAKTP